MTHAQIVGSATPLTPLLCRDSMRRANVLQTLPRIPGSALLGHLAERWIRKDLPVDHTFRRIFQSGDVVFHHASPIINGVALQPAPFTLQACKTHALEPGHLVIDLAGPRREGRPPACTAESHEGEAAPLKRLRGWVGPQGQIVPKDPPTVLTTHVSTHAADDGDGPDPARAETARQRVAVDRGLFSTVSLSADTRWQLRISGDDALLGELWQVLDPSGDAVAVGGARTTRGWLDVAWTAPAPATGPGVQTRDVHTITLASDTVILDRHLRGITAPDADLVAELTGLPADSITLESADVRATTVGGWSGLHQAPKPFDTALAAGSVLSFRTTAPVDGMDERRNVGFRRAEGMGERWIDAPIHAGRWQGTVLSWPAPAGEEREDQRRLAVARSAKKLVEDWMSKDEHRQHLSRSMWQSLESLVRSGVPLQMHSAQEVAAPAHQQSTSGRGSGAGRERRKVRNTVIAEFERASDGLDATSRRLLAEDIGEEIDLANAQRRDTRERLSLGGDR